MFLPKVYQKFASIFSVVGVIFSLIILVVGAESHSPPTQVEPDLTIVEINSETNSVVELTLDDAALLAIALDYLRNNQEALGLTEAEIKAIIG